MKRLKNCVFITSFLFFALLPRLYAQDVDVAIRFVDKRVYYAGSSQIPVQITVSNKGPSSYRFKLADERAFSIDFDVRDLTNRPLPPTEILIRKRTQDQQVFFREISVESGESFSFVENISEYSLLRNSGSFIVQAKLYPELYKNSQVVPIESNRLPLNLYPAPLPGPDGTRTALDIETGAVLVRQDLPPDQVIEYMLLARQKSQWEKFFLYLDLEAMITRDSARRRSWQAESEEGRMRMLDRYRSDLRSSIVDGDISTIPVEFDIERTSYSQDEGTVSVLEKFSYETYVERKRYTYYLRRRDGIWMVIDYSVVNLGTE